MYGFLPATMKNRLMPLQYTGKIATYVRRWIMIRYGFKKELPLSYEEVVVKVTEALKKEGFGILTEINIKDKLKEKLGVDFNKYIILGACNPPNAFRALQAEPDIGLMLPCNVIVYEAGGKTVLAVIKPSVAMQMVDNKNLGKTAVEVEGLLKKVFDAVT
jgi:uncharacterized protein (DUF302 family)